jgi:hypothetical protein
MYSCDHGDMIVVYTGKFMNSLCPLCALERENEEFSNRIDELESELEEAKSGQ